MKIFTKNLFWLEETIGGPFAGIVVGVIVFFINPEFESWKGLIKEFSSLGMCSFGFLLTLLAVILQGTSSAIQLMEKDVNLFNRFISYNKRIVVLSFTLSFYSYFLGNSTFLLKNYFHISECYYVCIFAVSLTWFVHDAIHFINLFYLLIQKRNDIQ